MTLCVCVRGDIVHVCARGDIVYVSVRGDIVYVCVRGDIVYVCVRGDIVHVCVHCHPLKVRMSHNLRHDNVRLFMEWYETPQHIWVISELCSGGRCLCVRLCMRLCVHAYVHTYLHACVTLVQRFLTSAPFYVSSTVSSSM